MNDVDLEDIYELSPMQQGMLFQHLYSPGADAYVNQVGVDVEGRLDPDAVRQALRHVMSRHAVLRTSFVWQGVEQPYQVVHPAVQPTLACLDFAALPQAEQEARFEKWLEADRRAGFDLREAPLLRLTMIALGPTEARLIWTFHHSVLEGLSFSIVLGEFWQILGGIVQGAIPDLPQPKPYCAYIEWLRGRDRWQAERYWRRTLAGIGETTHLFLDRDPGGERATAAGVQERTLLVSASCLAGLRELARTRRLTLNTLIQGAVAILARCYSEGRDVVFGEVVSGRPEDLPDAHAIVGMFVNTLPARVAVDAQAPLAAWLETMQRSRAEMREYSWCSLVDVQGWSEIPRGQPLFELLYVFENQYYDAAAANVPIGGDIALRKLRIWKSSDQPLTIDVFAGQEPLPIVAFFDPRRYGAHDVERLLDALCALLERFVATPDCRVGELFSLCGGTQAALPAAMRQQLLQEWNATAAAYPRESGVHELIEAQVRRAPQRVAIVHEGVQLSYAELDARANAIGQRLRARGAGRGSRVGLCLERGVDMLAAMLGILKSGAAYVPLDPGFPPERLRFMAQDAELALLVSTTELAGLVDFSAELQVLLDSDPGALGSDSVASARAEGGAQGEDPAYLIYTSGSTGKPKGVVVPHRAVVNFLTGMAREPGLREDDALLAVTTLSFDIAVLELLLPLVLGAKVVIATRADGLDGRALARLLREYDASVMQATPATWRLLVEAGWSPRPGFKALAGGEALARDLAGQLLSRGAELWNMYGPTETTVWSTCARIVDAAAPIPIGRPIANTVVRVLDALGGLCAVGVPGELYIGGEGVSLGYWKQPELTAQKFVPDPFAAAPQAQLYRTGDRARWRDDGCLEHLGRLDDQVKIRGYRIELGEIEEVLRTHEQVGQAVVASRKIGAEPRLVAYVVGSTGDARLLDAYLRERLPGYMLPSAWVFLDALPLTPNGKVDRRALPAPATLGLGRAEYIAPRSPTERVIADIWCEVLGVERVAAHDGFFELGGHSLQLMAVSARLETALERSVAVTDLFRYPSVQALARFLDGDCSEETPIIESARQRVARWRTHAPAAEPIAVVAMAGRFPGAADLDAYWRNLAAGAESIRFFERAELLEAGVNPELLADPSLVPARGVLDGIEGFDAEFFGYSPREAELLDPQQRIFLECAWEALERAGYDPLHIEELVGVYAGATASQYQLALMARPDIVRSAGAQGLMGNDSDFLPMRVSYKLDLRGPSVNVQTTCSTSLVAVHEACKALTAFECDVALAGGVTALADRVGGYRYQEGGILSPDGHCRPFDARARGTVFGEGAGAVVLKRLSDALSAGDPIRAVIRGTAVNNDGADKVGFTAPSVSAQARLVALAHAAAGVDAASIAYVEAHGTGTALGDPIELAALRLAFAQASGKRCAIGSVKANIGHLDRAAGVAGLIKTVLMLERAMLPPAVNFETPHPELESGPFFVNTRLTSWERRDGTPRRAGVSSFGMGGTNAHVVLEEAPPVQPSGPSRPHQLLLLSARSEAALAAMRENLAAHLEAHPEASLADVAHTLRLGRTPFAHRRAIACSTAAEAVQALRAASNRPAGNALQALSDAPRPVVFMFPGQGAQHPNMGRALYEREAGYRQALDACCEHLKSRLGLDLRELLFPASGDEEEAARRLERTALAQPALFATEYAAAQLLAGWGIRPAAMIGHSVGELVAACLARVLTLEDALALVAERGRLMEAAREGAMLSVALSAHAATAYTGEDVWLAAVNGETACALSCTLDAAPRLEARLAGDGVQYRRLRTSHAFHSALMAPAMAPLHEFARSMRVGAIGVPYISNVSGTWMDAAMLADGAYWSRHVREPVLFHPGIERLLQDVEAAVLLEVGPGRALSQLARAPASRRAAAVVTTLGAVGDDGAADAQLTRALGELWTCGVAIDWKSYVAGEHRRRVELPPYPFQRKRFWVSRNAPVASSRPAPADRCERKADIADWFSVPIWQRMLAPAGAVAAKRAPGSENWLIFADACGLGRALGMRLRARGHRVAVVVPGSEYSAAPEEYTIQPAHAAHYEALFDDLGAHAMRPQRIVHAWAVTGRDELEAAVLDERCFLAPLRLVQCLGRRASARGLRIDMVADEMHEVTGSESILPEKALILGPCRVAPLEHAAMTCRGIDMPQWPEEPAAQQALVETLLGELDLDDPVEQVVAFRNGYRWLPRLAPVPLQDGADPLPRLRQRGVYLVTGGLGGIGLCIADYLAQAVRAQLVLVGRSGLPPQDQWDAYLESHDASDPTARRILAVRGLRAKGANVRVETADVADRRQMTAVIQRIREDFGALHGVIHAAGMPGGGLIQLKTREAADAVLRPKVAGTRLLAELLVESPPDFMLLCSSINALVAAPGQVDYTAANAYLDAFALTQRRRAGTYTVSVNWDTWREVGMAVEAAVPGALAARRDANLGVGIGNGEGVEAFRRVLASALPQLVVSPHAIERASAVVSTPEADASFAGSVYERPELEVDYVAPRDETERKIARMWSEFLGIARVGVHDDFLDLGGHSLLATRLLDRLRSELGADHLNLEDILAEPTVAGIARRIRDRALSSGRIGNVPEPAAGVAAESQTTSRGSASDLLARVYAASKGKSLTGQ